MLRRSQLTCSIVFLSYGDMIHLALCPLSKTKCLRMADQVYPLHDYDLIIIMFMRELDESPSPFSCLSVTFSPSAVLFCSVLPLFYATFNLVNGLIRRL